MDRNVRRVAAARFVSRVGGEAAFFVGIWGTAVFKFDSGPGEVALLMAVYGLVSLAAGSLAGMLVDRHDPRIVLLAGEILFVPAALAATQATDMGSLTWAVAAMALFSTPVFTAIASFAPYLTDQPERLGRINGIVEAAGMAAFVAGPGVGALIANWWGLSWIFVFDAATSLAAVAIVLGVSVRAVAKRERRGVFSETREGFAYTYANRPLRFYVLCVTSVWLVFGFFSALEAIFYREVLGANPTTLGLVNSLFGIGLVGGSALVARLPDRLLNARSVTAIVGANGLCAALYTGTDLLPVVMGAGVLWGMVIGLMVTGTRTLIQRHSPEPLIGRIAGTVLAHNQMSSLLPLAFVPVLAATLGVQRVLVMSGLLLITIAALAWPVAASLDAAPLPRAGQHN